MNMQDAVTDYAKLSSKQTMIKDRMQELHPILVKYLRKHDCPEAGPYLLVLNEVERTTFSWKDYAHLLGRKLWGKDVKKMIKSAVAKAEKTTVDTLLVRINEAWK